MSHPPAHDRPGSRAPRPVRRHLWPIGTVAALLVLGVFVAVRFHSFGFTNGRPRGQPPKRLARLELLPLTAPGEPVTLADLDGRVVLLTFWGAWSNPCRLQLSHIAELETRFRDRPDVMILAVSCGAEGSEDLGVLDYETRLFLRQANIELPTYADPGSVSRRAVEEAVGPHSYPLTLILDRRGAVRGCFSGDSPGGQQQMRQLILRLLAEE